MAMMEGINAAGHAESWPTKSAITAEEKKLQALGNAHN